MAPRATLEQMRALGIDSQAMRDISEADRLVALDAARARIDTALATRSTLPIIAPYPMDLIECECVLGSWTALISHGYAGGDPNDKDIRERVKYWEEYLIQIVKGLPVPVVEEDDSDGIDGPSGPQVYTSSQRGWSRRGTGKSNVPFTGD